MPSPFLTQVFWYRAHIDERASFRAWTFDGGGISYVVKCVCPFTLSTRVFTSTVTHYISEINTDMFERGGSWRSKPIFQSGSHHKNVKMCNLVI